MRFPKEIWVDTDLVGDDRPHEGWQRYVRVDTPSVAIRCKHGRLVEEYCEDCYKIIKAGDLKVRRG